MESYKISSKAQAIPDLQVVCAQMECTKENPKYEEIKALFYRFFREVCEKARPQAVYGCGSVPAVYATQQLPTGTEVLYLFTTVGDEISQWSSEQIAAGNYLEGLLIDAMADSCLFSYTESVMLHIRDYCRQRKKGIAQRLEAPTDVPIELLKEAHACTNAGQMIGIELTSGYMLKPLKSMCQIFELTDNTECFKVEHDCTRCGNKKCALRQVAMASIIIRRKTKEASFEASKAERAEEYIETCIEVKKGENLLDVLREHGYIAQSVCGGNGTCKKCQVEIEGVGKRLACETTIEGSIVVEVEEPETNFAILAADAHIQLAGENAYRVSKKLIEADGELAVAVDIGTTTLAFSLVNLSTGKVINSYTRLNHQCAYGADVISRMQASNEGQAQVLQKSIQEDLCIGIGELLKKHCLEETAISRMVISANTTMGHLLLGYSCETLGVHPFTPVSIATLECNGAQLLGKEVYANCKVTLLPGISAFVGADIVSGMYQCAFTSKERPSLLIDLGTNGEMAIGTKDRLLVTSAAAGPAFEGGNITYGIGSVAGAICGVHIEKNKAEAAKEEYTVELKTIANAKPCGICGTGVLEAIARLLEQGVIDETGYMAEAYFEKGFPLAKKADGEVIFLTQKDVREIQLAKSAVRAGLETLLLRYGVTYDELENVYLAGGFGHFLDVETAVRIGMLPKELKEKTVSIGNASLNGAIRYLLETDSRQQCEQIVSNAEEISLARDVAFQDLYMEHMMFESE